MLLRPRHRASTSRCPSSRRAGCSARCSAVRPRWRRRRCSGPGRSARVLLLALLLPGARLRRRGAAQPGGRGAGAALRDDRERRGAGDRARPVGERPAAGAARPGGDPRARARARRRRGCGSRSTRRRRRRSLRPGVRLLGQARLSPPAAPAEPGGFDFRRVAWFERHRRGRLRPDAVARDRRAPTPRGCRQLAFRLRMALSAHIQARIPGQNGAFAAAILTGDRSGIDRSRSRRRCGVSTLYHIVSISGLHMSAARRGGLRDRPLRAGAGAAAGAALAAEEDRGGGGAGRRRSPTSPISGSDVRGAALLRDDRRRCWSRCCSTGRR